MTPSIYPQLVNDRFGDPALYVDLKFERRAILIDLGDLHALPPKKILRVTDIFVSHTHIDHFIGFDHVLRVMLGRERAVRIVGPAGIIDRVEHKLGGYSWNLIDRFSTELAFHVMELHEGGETERATFRLKDAFRRKDERQVKLTADVFHEDAMFKFRATVLDHRIPCLGFAIEERAHVNVSEPALAALGLAVGPWLRDLKHAVLLDRPDDTVIQTVTATGDNGHGFPLGTLREKIITVTRGQKVAYIVDVRDTPSNAERITALARDADTLFIEATFSKADSARAADRYHLTTEQAGRLARQANVRLVVPFHFSPRYAGEEERLEQEVQDAFRGRTAD
jgi:ribonuclease Z